jgi:catechol 2,3-dioxygenase-like lactoylglutathione lyase family enzyme
MYAQETRNTACPMLRVSSLRRSGEFYADLLGLAAASPEDGILRMRGPGEDGATLLLKERAAGHDAPDLCLSIEVDSLADVLDLYLLAAMLGARALLPRRRGDLWKTVITDPDGYRISVWARVPAQAPTEAFGRVAASRSPRWAWDERARDFGGRLIHEETSERAGRGVRPGRVAARAPGRASTLSSHIAHGPAELEGA